MGQTGGGAAMKPQLRRTAGSNHLDITPEDSLSMTGPEGFHRRFFCGEPAGKMRCRISPSRGVSDLSLGKDTAEKPIAEFRNRGFDAVDFGGIHADADNIHGANGLAKA